MRDSFTPRDKQVAQFIFEGRLNQGIAEILGVSPRTVDIHRTRLMEKFGASTIEELVEMVRSLIDADSPLLAAHEIIKNRQVWRVDALEKRLKSLEAQLAGLLNQAAQDEPGSTQPQPNDPSHLER